MKQKIGNIIFPVALLSCVLFVSGCTVIPEAGTSVSTSSAVFRQTARDLEGDCARMGGCTCIIDGIQTTCAVVFACLDAGFCKLKAP